MLILFEGYNNRIKVLFYKNKESIDLDPTDHAFNDRYTSLHLCMIWQPKSLKYIIYLPI